MTLVDNRPNGFGHFLVNPIHDIQISQVLPLLVRSSVRIFLWSHYRILPSCKLSCLSPNIKRKSNMNLYTSLLAILLSPPGAVFGVPDKCCCIVGTQCSYQNFCENCIGDTCGSRSCDAGDGCKCVADPTPSLGPGPSPTPCTTGAAGGAKIAMAWVSDQVSKRNVSFIGRYNCYQSNCSQDVYPPVSQLR
jgi:hypothetical protein